MDVNMLHEGMLCTTEQGCGWVVSVDRRQRKLRLQDQFDKHEFEVDFASVLQPALEYGDE